MSWRTSCASARSHTPHTDGHTLPRHTSMHPRTSGVRKFEQNRRGLFEGPKDVVFDSLEDVLRTCSLANSMRKRPWTHACVHTTCTRARACNTHTHAQTLTHAQPSEGSEPIPDPSACKHKIQIQYTLTDTHTNCVTRACTTNCKKCSFRSPNLPGLPPMQHAGGRGHAVARPSR